MDHRSYAEALACVLAHCAPLPGEAVPFAALPGRVLAAPLLAAADDPAAAKSAMDGYALRSADTRAARPDAPVPFAYRSVVGAGHGPAGAVGPGEAVRIMTGALLPAGADAVVKLEDTRPTPAPTEPAAPTVPGATQGADNAAVAAARGGRFLVTHPLREGENVIARGAVLKAGQRLLPAGMPLGGQALGLIAGQGRTELVAVRRPRVVLLALGDELVEPGAPLAPGQLYVSNSYALEALSVRYGAEALRLGIARDDPAAIAETLRPWVEGGAATNSPPGGAADVVLTLGGTHQGDFDFVDTVLAALGTTLHFRRTRINMGASTLFATRGATLCFGLSGAPMASWLAFEVLVRPALWRLLGREPAQRPLLRARLTEPFRLHRGRTHFVPAQLTHSADADPQVLPVARGVATALPPSVLANALIHWPEDAPPPRAGDWVPVEPLGEG